MNTMNMKKKFLLRTFLVMTLAMGLMCGALFWAMLSEKDIPADYRIHIEKGQGLKALATQLERDNIIVNQWVFLASSYFKGKQKALKAGNYRLPERVSSWAIWDYLNKRPDTTSVRIIEGMRFAQMRKIINENPSLKHDTQNWSDAELLKKIDANAPSELAEGLFFPDTYEADEGSSDLQIYQASYRAMQKHLNQAWESRQANLPYQNPYELLIMASIIEKETAHLDDQRDVSAVFRNRLEIGMRLQTDPTVIYGMGDAYQGKIRRADLERDTPYNTYTRKGLTPSPIALPSASALQAAANPSDAKYLYFVSKLDGTGRSQFSHNLEEHNAAVRKYILKK